MRPSAITRWDLWLGGAVFVAVLAIGCAVIFLDALTPPWRNASILVALIAGCVAWRLPKLRWRFMSLLRALGDRVGVGEPTKIALPWIVDGDTIDDLATGIRYRFANIDAPETGDNAKCHNERLLGERTKNVANEYVRNARVVAVRRTWRTDIYGRVVAYVEVDGQDLGELLAPLARSAQTMVRPERPARPGRRHARRNPGVSRVRPLAALTVRRAMRRP